MDDRHQNIIYETCILWLKAGHGKRNIVFRGSSPEEAAQFCGPMPLSSAQRQPHKGR